MLSFTLENGGDWLGRHFAEVQVARYPDELRVTALEPLVAYFASLRSMGLMGDMTAAAPEEGGALRQRLLDRFTALAQERLAQDGCIRISQDGCIRISKDTGAFIVR